jgi:hypothetical protein
LLTAKSAHIVDATGKVRNEPVRFDEDGVARLNVSHNDLVYPFVVSFGFEAPPLGRRAPAPAGNQIKGRVMILLDTSGSMVWQFDGTKTTTHGDSPRTTEAIFCDNNIGTTFGCDDNVACTLANGGVNFYRVDDANQKSRMLASKAAIQNVVNAHSGVLDFGLERFAAQTTCTTRVNGTTTGRCVNSFSGTDGTGEFIDTEYGKPNNNDINITFNGSCGSSSDGGDVLVQPSANSGPTILRWVDYVEDFCSSTASAGGAPKNPEIRAQGGTPLARALRSARTEWYQPIKDGTSDPQINCRPYVLVVMSDGGDSCQDLRDRHG